MPPRLLAPIAIFVVVPASDHFGQGTLTPPGAPAPTMKTLDQLEPRSPLAGTSPGIGSPGSYYLTGNVQSIRINADNVTLDLNGFSVVPAGDIDGIGIASGLNRGNIVIRNGSVVGPGTRTSSGGDPWGATFAGSTRYGIVAYGRTAGVDTTRNVRLEGITVRGFSVGITITGANEFDGRRSQIQHCTVFDCGTGIRAPISNLLDVSVQTCTSNGIEGDLCNLSQVIVERCAGHGINGNAGTIGGCVVRFCGGNGINCSDSVFREVSVSGCQNGIAANNSSLQQASVIGNRGSGLSGSANSIVNAVFNSNGIHGIISAGSTVHGVRASSNAGAGVWCDDSSINECMIYNNGADGIRGQNSTVNACRSFGNDTNKSDGYTASDIYWFGGRQQANVAGSYNPAAPAP